MIQALHPQAENLVKDVDRLLRALLQDGNDRTGTVRFELRRGQPASLSVMTGPSAEPPEILP